MIKPEKNAINDSTLKEMILLKLQILPEFLPREMFDGDFDHPFNPVFYMKTFAEVADFIAHMQLLIWKTVVTIVTHVKAVKSAPRAPGFPKHVGLAGFFPFVLFTRHDAKICVVKRKPR